MTNSKNSSNNSSKGNELYAIAETSGQQFWFEVNRYYDIDRLNAKEKDKVTLEKVLLLKDKNSITIGQPYICLLYTSPSPRDSCASRMPSSA